VGQLRRGAKRFNVKFVEVFAGELARSFARGIVFISATAVLEIVHKLLA
jgi:hypothetical protein